MTNKTKDQQEQWNKEFMAHLDRVIPYDKVKSKIAGERRAKESNEELANKPIYSNIYIPRSLGCKYSKVRFNSHIKEVSK